MKTEIVRTYEQCNDIIRMHRDSYVEAGQCLATVRDLELYRTKGGYETFEVTNVPGRSRILFHVGNTAKDVQGCIALGRAVPGDPFVVVNSRATFKEFMSKLEGIETFQLTILNNPLTT